MITPPLAISALRSVIQLAPVAFVGVLYARRAQVLAAQARAIPRWRQACFYTGLVTIAVAVLALDHIAAVSLSWRTVQQLILGDLAPLLIVLGLTAPLIAPRERGRVARRLRALASPPLAFGLWCANLYLWHLRVLAEPAAQHELVFAIENLCFVVFGVNMWMCLFGPLPMPRWFGNVAKLCYVLAVRIASVILANLLLWSGKLFYPFYLHPDSARHISPLVDQNLAGAIMMVESVLLTLALFGWLYVRMLREVEGREAAYGARSGRFVRGRPRPASAGALTTERWRSFEPGAELAPAVAQPEALDTP